ncbi:MAG: ImmA/IrrE family metallo-endopeptidase [Spirochaetales bacterium]|nr:ImmA/IrrE family metallo-endopeptidase [Spirochaetales bacterium]
MLGWARQRSGVSPALLQKRFPKLEAWENGRDRPTLKQLESFARATHAPVGFFFLGEPPREAMPLPDFRAPSRERPESPSPDLLDTVYLCQQRQEWYREYALTAHEDRAPFVGSADTSADVTGVAADIRRTLRFDVEERRRLTTWTEALRLFIHQADDAGIMVMCSGIVGNNTHRRLNPDEFRGFAIADDLAPLVFVNGADYKAAQMFTLAHELAHIWLGQTAVSDVEPFRVPDNDIEQWCNKTAAEILVPFALLTSDFNRGADVPAEANRLARAYKVSTLVILRRMYDAGLVTRETFQKEYREELKRLAEKPKRPGGDFYLSQASRLSRRFATAIVTSALEGQTLFLDAFHMLGIKKMETFRELAHSLGV